MGDPEDACCVSKEPCRSRSSKSETSTQSKFPTLNGVKVIDKASATCSLDDIDIESADFEVEHVILSVQGMTCTGCEKKLYRVLNSLPTISNVETSLVLSQAKFNFSKSGFDSTARMIKTVERMTGFKCVKLARSGVRLDLVRGFEPYCANTSDVIEHLLQTHVVVMFFKVDLQCLVGVCS